MRLRVSTEAVAEMPLVLSATWASDLATCWARASRSGVPLSLGSLSCEMSECGVWTAQ
jgi:hypothetical protein